MIRMKNHGDVVVLGHEADVLGPGNGAQNGRLLVRILNALAGQESGAAIGELDDDWGVDGAGRLQYGIDGGCGCAVESCKGTLIIYI
jgi:hypothetical protein